MQGQHDAYYGDIMTSTVGPQSIQRCVRVFRLKKKMCSALELISVKHAQFVSQIFLCCVYASQQTLGMNLLVQCWAGLCDAGPTLNQPQIYASCICWVSFCVISSQRNYTITRLLYLGAPIYRLSCMGVVLHGIVFHTFIIYYMITNHLSSHDASKHHFTPLKTDLIFLQPRVLEWRFL